MAYNANGTVSSSTWTVVLSGASGGTFLVWFIEGTPPAGILPAFDGNAVVTNASCSTCTMAAPTVTGTDWVVHFPNPTQTQNSFNPASSPYFQDWNGEVFGQNITSSTAPTFAQTSGPFMDSAISFKTTVAFTPTTDNTFFTMVNISSPNFSYVTCNLTCTVTTPSTTAGNLLVVHYTNTVNGSVTAINNGGSWVFVSGANTCRVVVTSTAETLGCDYVLSATGGVTSLQFTVDTTGSYGFMVSEVHRTSGSWLLDTQASQQNAACTTNCPGPALTLTGSHGDVVFSITYCNGGYNSVNLFPLANTNATGGNGPMFTGNSGGVARINTNDGTAPIWGATSGAGASTGIAFK